MISKYKNIAFILIIFFFLMVTILTCVNPVRDTKPRLTQISDTTISVCDTLLLTIHEKIGSPQVFGYSWFLDGLKLNQDALKADSVHKFVFAKNEFGNHSVVFNALGDRSAVSEPETVFVHVNLNPPNVHFVSHDTTIDANDSLILFATGNDSNGRVIGFVWQANSLQNKVASKTGELKTTFGADSGNHVVTVMAMDDDSVFSNPDSLLVTVRVNRPKISADKKVATSINDTIVVFAQRLDTFSTNIRYVWAKNGSLFTDTTAGDSVLVSFGKMKSGVNKVLVKALDNHKLESNIDTIIVDVGLVPPIVSLPLDTTVFINDKIVVHATATDSNGKVERYIWAKNGETFSDTTTGDSITLSWTRADTGDARIVKVKVMDNDTVESAIDSIRVHVVLKAIPSVQIMQDTAIFINDTLGITASSQMSMNKSPVSAYIWLVDNGQYYDTTRIAKKEYVFSKLKAGIHQVKVWVIDADTMESKPDSMILSVRLGTPVVAAKDTSVYINDTTLIRVMGFDTNGTIAKYIWTIDSTKSSDTTSIGVLKKVWAKSDTGQHTVSVEAIDDDSLVSVPCLFKLMVNPGYPVVKPVQDTSVQWGDTAKITIQATDPNGRIARYLWNVNKASNWTDSTVIPSLGIFRNSLDSVNVAVQVIDNDGFAVQDTFSVRFTHALCTLSMPGFKGNDTVYLNKLDVKKGNLKFTFKARRKDQKPATFTYAFFTGLTLSTLTNKYQGADTTFTLATFDTGKIYWKIVATNQQKDTLVRIDSLRGVIHRQVCFIGHSIIVGFDGLGTNDGRGGFRRMVLDSMRKATAALPPIRCVGSTKTNYLLPSMDDSSIAVSGKTCKNIYDSLFLQQSVKADLWVYMCGVNEGYNYPAFFYQVATIDSMHNRNPKSEIYVFNGLPFPKDTNSACCGSITASSRQSLNSYNRMTDSVITKRRTTWVAKQEGGIWLVNTFPVMGKADSTYNSSLYGDLIHPNQSGYIALGKELLKVMRAAKSTFY